MLTIVQSSLLSALAAFLQNKKYDAIDDIDWKELFKESVSQTVDLSCLQGLCDEQMPEDIKKSWRSYAMRSLQSIIRIHEQHSYVHQLMVEADIQYVILKGSSSAYYYPDSIMRAMGDVDFLVSEQYAPLIVKILKKEGWETSGKWEGHHIAFHKGSAELELHREPAGIPKGEIGERLAAYFKDVFDFAQEVEIAGSTFRKPSDFHHGLILLMHTYHHLSTGGLGLRQFCDWAAFLLYFKGESFATEFKEKLSSVGLWKFAQIISYICYLYLQIPYCEWMGEQDKDLCELVIKAVFQGGNFGQKEGSVAVGTVLLGEKESLAKKQKPVNIIALANTAGRLKYPKLAKVPIIKHLLFIPMGFRFIWQKITGVRKGRGVADAMQTVEAKDQVYKQFELFEVE